MPDEDKVEKLRLVLLRLTERLQTELDYLDFSEVIAMLEELAPRKFPGENSSGI